VQVISCRDPDQISLLQPGRELRNQRLGGSTSDAVSGGEVIQFRWVRMAATAAERQQPALRGLAAPTAWLLGQPWIESIEIIKGTGSVVNGYEATAGEREIER
jgi:hypothetical protein